MTAVRHHLTLVSCPPLDGSLTEAACVRRYSVANGVRVLKGHNLGNNQVRAEHTSAALTERLRASACRGCAHGKARAGG